MHKYEDAAAAFLQTYPPGTKIRGEEIITWAERHGDGLASDLLIGDDDKKLSALRRHLNAGGASRSFAEEERFVIDVNDARRKIFTIRPFAEHVYSKSEMAFGKSARAGLAPITAAQKAIEDVKLEELDEAERAALEARMTELVNIQQPLKKLYNEQTIERWVLRLESKGYSKEQAKNLIELLPLLRREMKLIELTS